MLIVCKNVVKETTTNLLHLRPHTLYPKHAIPTVVQWIFLRLRYLAREGLATPVVARPETASRGCTLIIPVAISNKIKLTCHESSFARIFSYMLKNHTCPQQYMWSY
jgi:hypothetical protein